MENNLQEQLFEKYPNLFSNKDKDIMSSCMAWGIECGDGWYEIISSLCWMIKEHEENIIWQTEYVKKTNPEHKSDYVPVRFDQIKEKYGGLRIYLSGGDSYIRGLVGMANAISYKTCEICGNKGKSNKSGWITTLCDEHLKK
jgi:hypothetical protein